MKMINQVTHHFTTIDLLRHGQVQGGACYRGTTNDPLSEYGWQQMQQATNNQTWDSVISSPLIRCADFAKTLSGNMQIHPDLKEINFGDWEGKTSDEIARHSPEQLEDFMNDPEKYSPPNGEKLSLFRTRVINEWNNIVSQHKPKHESSHTSRHILLISHGGTMRTIISHILNIPAKDMMRLEVPYASMSRIKIFHEGDRSYPNLVFHGKEYNT